MMGKKKRNAVLTGVKVFLFMISPSVRVRTWQKKEDLKKLLLVLTIHPTLTWTLTNHSFYHWWWTIIQKTRENHKWIKNVREIDSNSRPSRRRSLELLKTKSDEFRKGLNKVPEEYYKNLSGWDCISNFWGRSKSPPVFPNKTKKKRAGRSV